MNDDRGFWTRVGIHSSGYTTVSVRPAEKKNTASKPVRLAVPAVCKPAPTKYPAHASQHCQPPVQSGGLPGRRAHIGRPHQARIPLRVPHRRRCTTCARRGTVIPPGLKNVGQAPRKTGSPGSCECLRIRRGRTSGTVMMGRGEASSSPSSSCAAAGAGRTACQVSPGSHP